MRLNTAALTLLILPLSACGLAEAIQDNATVSGFVTPTSNGVIVSGVSEASGSSFRVDGTDGFAYQAGSLPGTGLAAYSGILPTTQVEAWPTMGGATYRGSYEGVRVGTIMLNGSGEISGFTGAISGDVVLTASFRTGSLTGGSDDGLLDINGQVSTGGTLSGSVVYNGVSGDLTGVAGGDRAVGAFHGNNADYIYAGGFVADPD